MVSAGRGHSPHSSSFAGSFNRNVPRSTHLLTRRYRVARALARFHPLRFFLWGYLKAEVYKHRPQTLKALKNAIREEVATIPPEMTNRVMENFRERLRAVHRE